MNVVGALGRSERALVDACGNVAVVGTRWMLGWWVGADDRWRFPTEEAALRQSLVESMPVVRTALRVPDGDAVQTVYGRAEGAFVAEITNDSSVPFALALVVSGARSIDLEGSTVIVDGAGAFSTPRTPRGWAVSTDGMLRDIVTTGDARTDDFEAVSDRRRRLEAAFLYPVPHRATLRVTLGGAGVAPEDDRVASPEDVARGWLAQLDRGMRVALPDETLQEQVLRARAQAALRAGMESSAVLLSDLEDWGLDDEAALAWERASVMDRSRARRRHPRRDTGQGSDVLREVRDRLAHETGETSDGRSVVEILTPLAPSWRGGNLDVRDVPLREGSLSYTVRWHGEHPALLWEMPDGIELRAPGLDPTWSTTEPSGEALIPLAAASSA